jgi:bacteriocin biosynthesis cyclodehydratase domain-containing protein
MTLRLDPRFPLVWRTPTSVQLGIDPPIVRLNDVTEGQERLLAALALGVTAPGLTMIAAGKLEERDELLAAVEPVLDDSPANLSVTVAVSGSGAFADALARILAASGVRVHRSVNPADVAETRPDLAVLAGHFVLPPESHGLWLRRDVPHLPVVFSDTGVVIGPFVEPGTGPCLLCLELAHRDADQAWPAIASQLLGKRGSAETAVLAHEAAGLAARWVLERAREGTPSITGPSIAVRLDAATGRRTQRLARQHPECGCRGISHLLDPEQLSVAPSGPQYRRGNDWADAELPAPVPS